MRISTAYFAGVGTVIVAVSAGLGGGYLAANIAHSPSQAVSKLERRMSAEPISVTTAPVPHVAAATAAAKPLPRHNSRNSRKHSHSHSSKRSHNSKAERRRNPLRRHLQNRRTGQRKNRSATGRFRKST